MASASPALNIFDLDAMRASPMPNDRGETLKLINIATGTENIDVHLNRLKPGGPHGQLHRHLQSDNVYIVRSGEALLVAGSETHTIHANQVVFIPAGMAHSLSNVSNVVFEMIEIYAPAGRRFDVTPAE